MIGQTISHYRVAEKLGEGGMGVVYKAHDTKLDRTVALKFLPPHLTKSEEDKQRFIREAKAAAALNHPHICTVYSVEEHEDSQFISMEYIDGMTLRQRSDLSAEALAKAEAGGQKSAESQPATWNQELGTAIDYALQIAEALQQAHKKGIVHRDIKPENIMLTEDNRIKVMDFGLAKLKGDKNLTKSGSTVGTMSYMSPEQIQGQEVDQRSDIFSFGIVLYEMLTGQTPFRGEHEAAMVYSIVNENPTPITTYITDAPADLIHILDRALDKDPDDRYQSVSDMASELRRFKKKSSKSMEVASHPDSETQGTGIPLKSNTGQSEKKTKITLSLPQNNAPMYAGVAVLILIAIGIIGYVMLGDRTALPPERIPVAVTDFTNETAAQELSGLSGMLITSLQQSERLSVMPRTRMFDILNQQGIDEVGFIDEDLGKTVAQVADLRALVSASIHQFGDVFTIDLKILDTERDEYIFAASEEGEGLESIPRMLDRLSDSIRRDFHGPLVDEEDEPRPVVEVTTDNLDAYYHYFRGEELINKMQFEEADEHLKKAIELDPEFGLAYFKLYYSLKWRHDQGMEQYIDKALEHKQRIPEKERQIMIAHLEEDEEKRIGMFRELLNDYPDDKGILFEIGDIYFHRFDLERSINYFEQALTLDPEFIFALDHITLSFEYLEEYEKMLHYAKRYINIIENVHSYYLLGRAYAHLRDVGSAEEVFRRAFDLFPDDDLFLQIFIMFLIGHQQFEKAENLLWNRLRETNENEIIREIYRHLGSLAFSQGRINDGLGYMDSVIVVNREIQDSTNIALTYAQKSHLKAFYFKQVDQAKGILDVAVNYYTDRIHLQDAYISHAYLGIGDLDGALEYMSDSWRRIDHTAHEHYFRSLYHFVQGDHEQHLYHFGYAENFPHLINSQNRYFQALSYYKTGKPDKAYELAEDIVTDSIKWADVFGTYEFTIPKAHYLLGRIEEDRGNHSAAIEHYQQFLDRLEPAIDYINEVHDAQERLSRLQEIV